MWDLDALLLARTQFAFTVSFHIVFPAITIGLASYLAVLEACWLRTGQAVFRDLYHFWSKIFAVNFAMGVVSGLVMAYQFGTNWSYFSEFSGGITGPLLTYEVLTAFFLEAGFLGVMLFGWNKVGPGLHFLSTIMVSAGTLISATWILASNSWMQTPQGHEIIDGVAVPVDWWAVIFNPSFPYRLVHMTMAAFLATALFVAATGAWHLLRGNRTPAIRKMYAMGLGMVLVSAPLQVIIGDLHGLNTLEHQPAKIAAIEGHWENTPGAGVPLILVGMPDMERETTRYSLEIPRLGGLILAHEWDASIPGLKDFPPEDRPNSAIVFWSFRVMAGLGFLMVLLGLYAAWCFRRGRLYDSRALARFALFMGPSGLVAILAGWFTTEIGRQPWVVYGLMRTEDAVSDHSVLTMSASLVLLVIVYFAVFGTGARYVLKLVARTPEGPPEPGGRDAGPDRNKRPARPLSAATERLDGADDLRPQPPR